MTKIQKEKQMRLGTEDLKGEREWRAMTGLKEAQYFKLLKSFTESYQEIYGQNLAARLQDTGITYCIKDENDLLFLTLFSLKSGVTYDVLGVIFKMHMSNAKRQQSRGLEVLSHALEKEGYMPLSDDSTIEEIEEFMSKCEKLIIDATENRIQRPQDKEVQKEHYSGKKKAHTNSHVLLSDDTTYIHYMSNGYPGKHQDFGLLKMLFEPKSDIFKNIHIKVDLGFLGFAKNYPHLKLDIPHKKPKNGTLTEEQKLENQQLAKERIYVEHSIGGMKRYRILMERIRIHSTDLYNKVALVCAGLWNFNLIE
ncbi:MAG: transposase [Okeania sp. SIO3B3]|nr:transposase [Okeania sp. SIO3B3]